MSPTDERHGLGCERSTRIAVPLGWERSSLIFAQRCSAPLGCAQLPTHARFRKFSMRILILFVVLLSASSVHAEDRIAKATHIVLATYAVAGYWDGVNTAYCHGLGTCHEANPIFGKIAEHRNIVTAMTVKGGLHTAIGWGLLEASHSDSPGRRKAALWSLVGLTAAQIGVNVHNVRELQRQRR